MKDISILFYNTMWGMPLPFMDESLPAGFSITLDKGQISEADVVVFHIPDLYKVIGDDEITKSENQIWVGWCLECEENYPILKDQDFRDMFDIWMGYHQNDDVIYPYYLNFDNYMKESEFVDFNQRKDVCMLISSNINKSGRIEYLAELMKYIHIDSYGKLFRNSTINHDCGRKSAIDLMRKYKFVIAFENAVAEDYVTEKFYNPLYACSVPIYLGAQNIDEFSPYKNCYMDVRSFSTPRELAEAIKYYSSSESDWMKFFSERNNLTGRFQEKLDAISDNPFIRLCRVTRKLLHDRKIV